MIFEYAHNGETYSVRLEPLPDGRLSVTVGERATTLVANAVEGGWQLHLGDRVFTVYAAKAGEERYVFADGQSAQLTRTSNRQRRRAATPSGGDLTAQMPGQVTAVLVAEGDAVERGQTLVILEAMKMELRVNAPSAGRVARLLVVEGDLVERGQMLVEVDKSKD